MLTDEERKKFADLCLMEVKAYSEIIEFVEADDYTIWKQSFVQRLNQLVEAYQTVHDHLVDCESFLVGEGEEGKQ